MKKLLALTLLAVLCFSMLGGCGKRTGNLPADGPLSPGEDWDEEEDIIPQDGSASAPQGGPGAETTAAGPDEPVAAVTDAEGNYGYINQKGEWVVAPQYSMAYPFCNGRAAVCTDWGGTEWQIIDKQNNIIRKFDGVYVIAVPASYYYISVPLEQAIVEDMIIITKDDPFSSSEIKYGFANSAGEIVLEPQYAEVRAFREGLAAVNFGTPGEPRWGYVDKAGRTVIRPQFREVRLFSDGLAYVEKESDPGAPGLPYGFIDTTGDMVIHGEADEMGFPIGFNGYFSDFYDGLAFVNIAAGADMTFGSTLSLIDKQGGAVWTDASSEYSRNNFWVVGDGLFAIFGKSDSNGDAPSGFMDMTGAVVIAPTTQWRPTSYFHEGLCSVRTPDNREGFIDKSGNTAVEIKYRGVRDFSCGLAAVSENGNDYVYIDKNGDVAFTGDFISYGAPFTV